MAYENHKRKTIRNKVRKGKCKEENEIKKISEVHKYSLNATIFVF
jgi:hypothetical protein